MQYRGDAPPPLNSRNAYLVKGALQDLSDFMTTASERENKNRQKLLRNLRVSYVKVLAGGRTSISSFMFLQVLELIVDILALFKVEARDEK